MNLAIELHDSEIIAVHQLESELFLLVQGFLHESEGEPGRDKGYGYWQMMAFVFTDGRFEGTIDYPAYIIDGVLSVEGELARDNMIPLPCMLEKPVELEVRLSGSGEALVFSGAKLSILRLGTPLLEGEFTPASNGN